MSFVSENFEWLSEIGEFIARQFGEDCEVVLHDLTRPYDSTIVAIWNGHITGREVGGSGTDAGLSILRGTVSPKDEYNYINTTKDGRILRSSSKYFKDKNGNAVGSLCINYDITGLTMGQKALANLLCQEEPQQEKSHSGEIFTSNIDELLETMMQDAVASTGHTVETLGKEDKVAVVRYLDSKGAFLIKKSAERVAEFLGISRFTVYNYLNESQEGM